MTHRLLRSVALAGIALSLALPWGRPASAAASVPGHGHVPAAAPADVQTLTLHSRALGGMTHVRILLPDSYATTRQRYPVLYLFGGHLGTHQQWETKCDVISFTRSLPLIVVMPDAGDGWFVDPPAGTGQRWEDYVIHELIPYVDTYYRTVANRPGRAVAGLSMGGLGAFDYAARHPDMFVAAASFSGSLNLIKMDNTGWRTAFPSLALFDGNGGTDLYWHGYNPVDLAPNLRGVRLYMASGNGQPGPLDGHRAWSDPGEVYSLAAMVDMSDALQRAGIPVMVESYGAGTHTWPYWTRDLHHALPLILDAFAHPPAPPTPWSYRTIDEHFAVWGYHVIRTGQPAWTYLQDVSPAGLTVTGSGSLTLVTEALYRPRSAYMMTVGGTRTVVSTDSSGRLYLQLALPGPATPLRLTIAPLA